VGSPRHAQDLIVTPLNLIRATTTRAAYTGRLQSSFPNLNNYPANDPNFDARSRQAADPSSKEMASRQRDLGAALGLHFPDLARHSASRYPTTRQ
jgi:hypothetical protein